MALLILYKVVLTLESVNGIPKYDHLNESYWAVIFVILIMITLHKVVLTFESGYNPKKRPLKWKRLSSTFLWSCSLSVDEIRKCVHSNESYWAILSWVRQYAVQGGSNFRVVNGIPKLYVTIQTKATELYFLVVRHFAVQAGSNFWVCAVIS